MSQKKIVKTGIVYLTIDPANDTEITVDGRILATKSPAKLAYLLPGIHKVKIKKTGYQTWQKNYDVLANNVIYDYNVPLFFEKPENKVLKTGVSEYFLSKDGKKILYNYNNILYFSDLDNGLKNTKKISGKPATSVVWSSNKNDFIYKTDLWYLYSNSQSLKLKLQLNASSVLMFESKITYISNNLLNVFDISQNKITKTYHNIFASEYIS
ncbi:MAG: PEGA domain-containing protein, partial [Candidatus Margulisiibacteriota bacterium]